MPASPKYVTESEWEIVKKTLKPGDRYIVVKDNHITERVKEDLNPFPENEGT